MTGRALIPQPSRASVHQPLGFAEALSRSSSTWRSRSANSRTLGATCSNVVSSSCSSRSCSSCSSWWEDDGRQWSPHSPSSRCACVSTQRIIFAAVPATSPASWPYTRLPVSISRKREQNARGRLRQAVQGLALTPTVPGTVKCYSGPAAHPVTTWMPADVLVYSFQAGSSRFSAWSPSITQGQR